MPVTLEQAEAAIRAAWSRETAYATAEFLDRAPTCRARGQCGPTALVLNDLFGGSIVVAPVSAAGVVDGVHYWNRIDDDWVDLTREQFLADESIGPPRVVERLPLPGPEPAQQAYLLLRSRVLGLLACD